MSFTDIVSKFNQQADSHSRSQTLNPFSDRFAQSRSPSPRFSREEYGKPVAGSKTDLRGRRAKSHICREILELCTIIHDVGTYNAKKRDPDDDDDHGIDDGTIIVSFGELFQIYTKISDKVVGLLIAAKRRGFVYFDREILFQRQDDDVLIALIKPISEIAKILKADIEQASAAAAEPTAPADETKPSTSNGRGTTRERAGTSNNCNGQVDGVDGGERNSMLKNNVVEISESKKDRDGGARGDAIDPERVGGAETEKATETEPGGVEAASTERAGGTGEDEESGKSGARTEGVGESVGVGEVKTERVEGTEEDEESGKFEMRAEGIWESVQGEVKTERVEGTGDCKETGDVQEGTKTEGVEETRAKEVKTKWVEGAEEDGITGEAEGIEGAEGVGGVTTEKVVQRAEGAEVVSTESAEGTGEDEKTGKVEGAGEPAGVGGVKIEEVGEAKTEMAEETIRVEGTGEIGGVHAEGFAETEVDGVKIEGVGRETTEEIEVEKTERPEGTAEDVETGKVEGVAKTEEVGRATTEGAGVAETEGADGSGEKNENKGRHEEVPDVAKNAKENAENVSSFFGNDL